MSGLGQYVHFTWSGYEDYGTYINKTNWRSDYKYKEKSNYAKEEPFEIFSQFIKTRAESIEKYDIQSLEEQYNNLRKKQFQDFKKLQNEKPTEFLKLMKRVVENANLGKLNPETLAQVLVLDEERETVMPKYLKALGEAPEIKKIRQLAKSTSGKERSFLETVRQALLTAEILVDNSPSKEALLPELQNLKDKIQNIEDIVTLDPSKYPGATRIKRISKESRFAKEGAYRTIIPRETARSLISEILSIAKAADIASMLAKLEGSFTEIMGTSLRPMVKRLAVDEIGEVFGSITSSPQIANMPGIHLYLDQKTMKDVFDKQKKGSKDTEVVTDLGDGVGFTFKTDYETQNKKDFVLEWRGRELSVSAKAYDLSVIDIYDKRTRKTIPNFISLQSGTSLLIFLLSIEQQNFYSSLGTHFLNVFAQHGNQETHNIEKEDGDFARVRKVAQDALTLGLLYTSLTGGLSGKEQNTFADILMIEDKSRQIENGVYRVRFYNINTIVSYIMAHIDEAGDKLYISPNLDTLTLDNTWSNRSAKERITKLLLDARQQKFKVGLNIRNLSEFREK